MFALFEGSSWCFGMGKLETGLSGERNRLFHKYICERKGTHQDLCYLINDLIE